MKYLKLFLLICFFGLSLSGLYAQDTTSDSLDYKPRIVGLPVVFYSPETRLGLGAAGFFSFKTDKTDSLLRPSQINLGFAYTFEKQILSYASFDMWAFNNRLSIDGELGYYRFFYNFWGVGEESRELEVFSVNFPRIRFEGFWELYNGFYAGPKFTYDNFDIVDREEGGRLTQNEYPGSSGGAISGLGGVVKYDTRNNNFYPSKGYYILGSYERFSKAIGSDFNYDLTWINAIKYFDLGADRVIAANIYGRFMQGNVPFFHLSQVGGNSRMRGYYEGYHRDKQMLGWQVEYRTPVYWRFGLVGFVGNAVVGETINSLKIQNMLTTTGAGLRFKLDTERKINLRLDFGISSDRTTGFYLTIAEAF